ncbi:hypothetical protein Tmar_0076 [Thermaerobacter marianensis DSM 12885]|uniref:SigmaK-factor processing regulatory BofA n=1 Tax=Thermaerobacter marianensis (strain ATCC 700841 / DSM 12885 / JCM 10246 / 7p75a) TaxID=644966 RepID=E6SKZ9_THEM7|nr:pro-sigmaK processing inhibitor BofA family protein [Thermaerobacter marianensis]ADU50201.1 hypothetical protein Tmar_0076 [Thermaerobacter marianensis DSM 12885]
MRAIAGEGTWAAAGLAAVVVGALAWRSATAPTAGEALARVAADLAVGSGWIVGLNVLLAPLGAHVGWNPATAWLAGGLGLPGVLALALLAVMARWQP